MAEALSVDKEKKDFFNANSYENNVSTFQIDIWCFIFHLNIHHMFNMLCCNEYLLVFKVYFLQDSEQYIYRVLLKSWGS